MNISDLQAALNARAPKLGLATDGIPGRKTMAAVDALLAEVKAAHANWPDARRLIAAEQTIYASVGIEVGTIDGLIGEQTRYARSVWSARQISGGKPAAGVEAWRDASPPVEPARAKAS